MIPIPLILFAHNKIINLMGMNKTRALSIVIYNILRDIKIYSSAGLLS